MRPPFRTIPPAEPPVSLTEVKAHCRVDHTDDDVELAALLAAATDHLDGPHGMLGNCMVQQTWCQRLAFFDGCVRLTVGPVASVTSIIFWDADNTQQTLSSSVYALHHDVRGAYVSLNAGHAWPDTYSREDAVSIAFVAGVAAADVPASLKAAVLMLVAHWYENREGGGEIPNSVRHLVGLRREVFV